MLFMGGSIYSSLREAVAFFYPHDPRAGGQRENETGAYISCESVGHRPSRGEAILVHNPELHGLVLKRATRTKTVREQRTRARSTRPTLILSSLFCGMIRL